MSKINLNLLEELTNDFGPSGFEWEVQKKMRNYVEKFADHIDKDRTGSLIFTKKGTEDSPKIMIAGHIDEIGFQIKSITKDGFLKFHQLGGWWDQTLLSQRVIIRTHKGEFIPGIITAKPPHVLSPEDRNKVVVKDKMYIDVGCTSKEEVKELGIREGDPVMPDAKFEIWERPRLIESEDGEGKEKKFEMKKFVVGKAFDDRVGAVLTAEIIRRLKEENIKHPNTVYGCSTTQEEVGLRGARTAAEKILPDLAIAIDVDISGDVPGIGDKAPAKMGKGPSLFIYDRSMIPNPRFRNFMIDLAEELNIPYQLSTVPGGTDAGVIHLAGIGCPSLAICVPTRHIHSHNGIISVDDMENTVELIVEALKRLNKQVVESFTEI
ncbi:MAG: M42 family metallopeptidase [Candidatus Heimdallarchaeum aukensis]|uniref:M42 family metallopeptidase n=1 Tax=Candidatus Heimdallarchaeum aukensis TaxID=2876573 RepID=A0A9Y1BKV9_9ARCH|nr:MAG: M42 family metallopeptidase [Candidatus Heimdallarchaeum aukensis]